MGRVLQLDSVYSIVPDVSFPCPYFLSYFDSIQVLPNLVTIMSLPFLPLTQYRCVEVSGFGFLLTF